MKVAYNACFGGFGLSPLGLTEFAKRKGIDLFWYKQVGYKHNNDEKYDRIDGIPTEDNMSLYPLISDYGNVIYEIPDTFYYPNFHDESSRIDNDLIMVIESLGKSANGMCADLKIAEIPDDSEFEITCYDGNESVVPPRPSW